MDNQANGGATEAFKAVYRNLKERCGPDISLGPRPVAEEVRVVDPQTGLDLFTTQNEIDEWHNNLEVAGMSKSEVCHFCGGTANLPHTDCHEALSGKQKTIRKFETGATRDIDTNKHDPEGFLQPLVIVAYNEYMHKHRLQTDGSLRASDNWQKGIPKDAYMKSMWRHFLDVWLYHRGCGHKAKELQVEALTALMFNVMGYLYEVLRERESQTNIPASEPSQPVS